MTNTEIKLQNPDSEPVEENYDPHRFTAEPKKKKSKTLLIVFGGFLIVVVLVGLASLFINKQVANYRAKNKQKSELAEDKRKSEATQSRAAKEFKPALPQSFAQEKPAAGSTDGTKKSATDTTADANAIPVEMNGKSKNLKLASVAGNSNSTENPTVNKTEVTVVSINMLDDEENDQKAAVSNQGKHTAMPVANPTAAATAPNSANSSNTSPVSSLFDHGTKAASKPKNVQELANKVAESAPLTNTPQVSAANLGNRSYLLARGAFMPCVLETQLVSNIAGYASCVLPQRIYSDDGKVVLLEKGSKIIGQYQNTVKNGDVRIAILWQRIKSATGVVIDVDSPAADGVGAMGAPGYVDNHWMERIGGAFLLSMVDDVIKMEVAKRQNEKQGQSNTVLLPTASIGATKSLSEKVLESTINIPPTIYKNRGERLMVYVNRDLWFDSVYHIKNLK